MSVTGQEFKLGELRSYKVFSPRRLCHASLTAVRFGRTSWGEDLVDLLADGIDVKDEGL